MSLIWPVTYSFNITLALGYIVLGIVLDCKPTPVPGLFIIGRKKKVPLVVPPWFEFSLLEVWSLGLMP